MERLNEVYLIRRVKEEQDMDALHELVERYRPLINGAKLNFSFVILIMMTGNKKH